MGNDELTQRVIGIAIQMHSDLGPGILESAYEHCFYYELTNAGFDVQRQKPLPLVYKNVKLDCGYRADLIVENKLIIEVKAVESLNEVHVAQVITYLKLSGIKVGLLINFNVVKLKQGIRRLVYRYDDPI